MSRPVDQMNVQVSSDLRLSGGIPSQGSGQQASAVAIDVAQGLRHIMRARVENDQQLPRAGIRFAPKDQMTGPVRLGPYQVVGDKAKGVEPGFIAKRAWTRSDDVKLDQPGHKFHQAAHNLLLHGT